MHTIKNITSLRIVFFDQPSSMEGFFYHSYYHMILQDKNNIVELVHSKVYGDFNLNRSRPLTVCFDIIYKDGTKQEVPLAVCEFTDQVIKLNALRWTEHGKSEKYDECTKLIIDQIYSVAHLI